MARLCAVMASFVGQVGCEMALAGSGVLSTRFTKESQMRNCLFLASIQSFSCYLASSARIHRNSAASIRFWLSIFSGE